MTRLASWWKLAARRKPGPLVKGPTRWLRLESLEDRAVPAAFTTGNVVVYRVGAGATELSNQSTAAFLDEYDATSGSLVQSIAVPIADNGSQLALTNSGFDPAEGSLSTSADGQYLLFAGYHSGPGVVSIASSSTTSGFSPVIRVIGRAAPNGTLDTSTSTTSFSGFSIRAATSTNGADLWAAGQHTGIVYTTIGGSGGGTVVSNNQVNNRVLQISNGQLYATSGLDVNKGVNTIGSGTPTTFAADNENRLPGLSDSTSPSNFSFFFADLTSSVSGVDTLYVADDAAAALTKFSFVGGNWVANGTVGATVPSNAYRGLAGYVNGTAVTLFATRDNASGIADQLVKLIDSTGYNGAFSGTPTVLATAGTNKGFRGVARVPVVPDTTAPTVANVTSTQANGVYKAGTAIDITVQFSENVFVSGTPRLTLETGTTDRVVNYSSTAGGTLTFTYTVQAGDTSLDLDYFATDSLALNGGTIRDAAGNNANLALASPSAAGSLGANKAIVIDTAAPSVANVTSTAANSSYNAGDTIDVTVQFNDNVTVTGTPTLTLETGSTDRIVNYSGGSGSNTLTFTYTVQAGDTSGDLDYAGTGSLAGGTIADAAGNDAALALAAPGAAGSLGANKSIIIDTAVPAVSSIVRAAASPTNAASVAFTVAFSEIVTGVGTTDFALTESGVSGASIAGISGTGTTYVVTVNTGSGDGSIRLDLIDDDSIADLAGNVLGGAGAQNFTSGEVFAIDKTFPTVSSIVRASANPSNAATVDFTVAFSEPVFGASSSDFSLTTFGMTGASITNVSGSGTTRTVTVNTGVGEGTIRLDVVDLDAIADAAGNKLGGAGAGNGNFTTGEFFNIDTVAPTVVSIAPAGSNSTNAASADFTVTFSEAVTGMDVADFALTTSGVSGASITGFSGSGTTNTVTVSTGSGEGAIRLDLIDDNSIVDALGNVFGGSGMQNFTGGQPLTIDRTAPAVSSIVRAGASPTNAAGVNFTVTFSEAVVGVNASDFALTTTGVSSASVANVSGSGTTYTIAVNTGSGDGTIRLDLADDDTIADLAGNALGGSFTGGQVYAIDKTTPAVLSSVRVDPSPTNAASVSFTVVFSESVSGVDAADFALATSGIAGASITGASGSGTDYTVTVNTGSSDGMLELNVADDDTIVDGAGNKLGGTGTGNGDFAAGDSYTIDKTAPEVSSIVRADGNPTNASSIAFTVTFDEPVTDVNASDFALAASGVSGASITGVSGNGNTYTVTLDTGTGDGTLQLDLVDDDTIDDGAGNKLGGTGTGNGDFSGPTYTIDKTAPTVAVAVAGGQADPTIALPILFGVLFSEPVVGFDGTCVTLSGTAGGLGSATITVSNPSSDFRTFTVSVANLTGDGTVTLSIAAGAVADAASNGNEASTATDATVLYDANAPTVASIARGGSTGAITNAASVAFTVTFSEPVSGIDTNAAGGFDNFSLDSSGLTGASITSIAATGDPRAFAIAIDTGTGDGTLRLDLSAIGAIVDAGGNPLAGTHTGDESFTIDKTLPDGFFTPVAPDPRNAAVDQIEFAFSENVSGLDLADFTLTRDGNSVALAGAALGGSGSGYTLSGLSSATAADGAYALTLEASGAAIIDDAGNVLAADASTAFTVDATAPSVASIVRQTPSAALTNASSATFAVAFSESVTGVGITDFALTTSVVSGASITGFSGTGSSYTVTVNTGTGSGSIRLDLADDDSIRDAATNPLGGTGAGTGNFTGQSYTIDRSAPTVTVNQASGQTDPANAQPIHFAVVFDEAVVGFGAGSVSLSGGAGATIAVTNPSADNRTFDVAVGGITSDGTLRMTVAAGAVIDAAGNANAASTGSDDEVTLDTAPPSVSAPDLTAASDSGVNADNITNDATPTFTGTASAGATVELFEGSTSLGTATATGGSWTITASSLPDGVHNVFVRASDAAGNTTDSAALGVTIDTVGPTVTVTRAPGQPAAATSTSPSFSASFTVAFSQAVAGLTAANLTVAGTAGGSVSNIAGSGATYTVTVSGLGQPGTVSVNVSAGVGSDVAGNPSAASGPGDQVTVSFATQTGLIVSPATLVAGDSVTATASVSAPAGSTPTGSILFTLTGPGGPIQRTVNLTGGSAATSFNALATGSYTIAAAYQPTSGYVVSNASGPFTVAQAFVPVDQNAIGEYAGAGGSGATRFNENGTVTGTFSPFSPAEAPGGLRVAVADLNGDGVPDLVFVTGPGSPALLRAFDGKTNQLLYTASLFEGFTGGAFVASGDLTGDGRSDLAVTPDRGGGPRVTILNGPNGAVLANFFAIEDPGFRGGARAALGDISGDGVPDFVVSAGFGGGPRVAGYDGTTVFSGVQPTHLFHDFFIFEEQLRNGAYVTVGDLNGDGFGDIIGGGGPGGGPRVLAFSGKALVNDGSFVALANFFAGDSNLRGGVRVAAKDEDSDGRADLITGSGDTQDLFVFFGSDLLAGNTTPRRSFQLPGVLDGVYVG